MRPDENGGAMLPNRGQVSGGNIKMQEYRDYFARMSTLITLERWIVGSLDCLAWSEGLEICDNGMRDSRGLRMYMIYLWYRKRELESQVSLV